MNAIFKKLNYKEPGQIYVVNAPGSFDKEIEDMRSTAVINTSLTSVKEISFFLAFVIKQKELDDLIRKVVPFIKGDGVLWFAYPKGTSKRYMCEFNRDTGWNELGKHGFEAVRAVAIDEDWSALRFRKADHIKTMTRSFAMTELGKKKIAATKRK